MAVRVRAGELRQSVTIQRAAISRNAVGEEVETWGTLAVVRAAAETAPGSEFFRGDVRLSEQPVLFTVRHRSNWTPTVEDRVLWDGDAYDIEAVTNVDGRNKAWEILGVRRGS